MTYNMTQLQAADTLFKLAVYANDATSGTLIVMLLLSVFFITLLALKRYSFGSALLSSSVVCFVISLLLAYTKMLNPLWPLGFFILAALSGFIGSIFD